jgi:hypothetical protein
MFTQQSKHPAADVAEQLLSREVNCRVACCLLLMKRYD